MTALAAAKNIVQYGDHYESFFRAAGVATGVRVYNGALVSRSAQGYITPATTALAQPIGVADLDNWDDQAATGQPLTIPSTWPHYVDNAGADDARKVLVRTGIFKFANKAGDLVTRALIGADVYVEDDQTVRATAAGSVKAGVLRGFADDGLPLVLIFKA